MTRSLSCRAISSSAPVSGSMSEDDAEDAAEDAAA
eukprot:CAMPEP_0205958520 /NCGR_PEP_ID=MMETSP1459-20131121/50501_1 /ASSEMBLY_ACC=CAM_ASM_001120 /TAXON_ID=41880 /ORGANISM="Pycnococcus provasolii, Strain RCC931" /LENGTH=34 /DNA_ID= /DNA_START= /DNA_END= /DNA_ORIENTATION=